MAGLLCAVLMAGGTQAVAAADPAYEPVTTHIEAINVAGRQVVADDQTWALSSTVVINVPGKKRASLNDVSVGERVRLELQPGSGDGAPVVRSLTVLPD